MVMVEELRTQFEQQLQQFLADSRVLPPEEPTLDIPAEYRVVIEEGLQLIYIQYYRITSRLAPSTMTRLSIEQLRAGPLGEDLTRLAQVAAGLLPADREVVLGAIDSVLLLLFTPAGVTPFFSSIPRTFWQTPLGQMISLAKLRTFNARELMSIVEAAEYLGVSRPTIYRWMDDRTLDWVSDGISGRTFVVRDDIEAVKAGMEAARAAEAAETARKRRRSHPFVSETPEVAGGYPVIRGTRIPLRAIIEVYRETPSIDSILEMYPHLTEEQVLGALEYYREYPERVDEDIATNAQAFLELRGR